MTRAPLLVAFALMHLAGCVEGPGPGDGFVALDYEVFVAEVQPLLADRCANPSCHGTPERPLEVFAVHKHRLDPDTVYLDAALTDDELGLGFLRASALVSPDEAPSLSPLVRKPLGVAAGGAPHVGGVQFERDDDPDYLTLLAWVSDDPGLGP
jgi:hypothetical protein